MESFPTPQGISCTTFKPPPLDGSLTLVHVFDFNATHNPHHPLFRYEDTDGSVQTIIWSSAVKAFHAAARLVRDNVPPVSDPKNPPVVSVLAAADSITYFALIAGIMCAGYQAFPISPRNSHVAVAHLLASTRSNYVFVSSDPAMRKLADAASRIEGASTFKVLPMPAFDHLFSIPDADNGRFSSTESLDLNRPAIILHSSGSTAFPKPITFTYRTLLQSGLLPYYGETDLCGQTLSSHAVPMFHLMGVVQIPWTAYTGLTIATFPPTFPPTIPTPDRVFESAIATGCTLVFCVPAFLESWARDPSKLSALKSFKTLIFAGGPLQPNIGDMLVNEHVNIVPLYGLTETGTVTLFLPKQPPKEGWDYFRFSSHCDPVCVPLEDQEGVYHLVMKECSTHTPAVLNTTWDGVRALNTNDLLVRHPTNPGLWKVFGRQDDQIMHSTGEKTNPIPIEAILLKDPRITSAIMFGRGKFHAGVLIAPDEPFDPTDIDRLASYRNSIWPTVEQANRFAPTHSRIFKEMILVSALSKPFELTAKGTPRRHVVLESYEQEIGEAYAAVEQSSQTHLRPPTGLTMEATLPFVRLALAEIIPEMPKDDDDIFQHGCDSLQVTWLRNTILHALRTSSLQVDTRAIPHNFVYAYPTARLLAEYMAQLGRSSGVPPSEAVSEKIAAMEDMVQRYVVDFPRHTPTATVSTQLCVLLTGTTGAFGCYILKSLLVLPEVALVYALNRPSSRHDKSVRDRQLSAFDERGVDLDLINSPKLRLLEGDLNLPNFGLPEEIKEDIHTKTTLIIHNAWQVDFNVSLASMEPLVSGTRHLIDFALSSPLPAPPKLVFVSSAGVFRNWTREDAAPEASVVNPRVSMGSGYSESKWVAEHILEEAVKHGLSPIIIRPGQLCGGIDGAWNPNKWFPALIRSSHVSGCLPNISGLISWVPIHEAATALVQMRTSQDAHLHLAHPNPVPISLILRSLASTLDIPLVPYAEWFAKLEAAATGAVPRNNDNPAVQLLEFFRSKGEIVDVDDKEAMFGTLLATTQATALAPALRSLPQLRSEDVGQWVAYWRKIGFLGL